MKKLVLATVVALLLAGAARAQTHQVVLNWTASTTTTVTGYNVYRIVGACPATPSLTAFTKLNTAQVTVLTYTDSGLTAGQGYCYTVTAVAPGGESGIASVASVTVPSVTAEVITNPPASLGVGSVQ